MSFVRRFSYIMFGKDEDVGEIVFGLGLGIVGPGGCIVGSRVGSGMGSGKGEVGDRLRPHPKIRPHPKKF
jgi:hypothetical protein